MTTTNTLTPVEYRKPWEHGAKAYHEVDTEAGLVASIYRKRKSFTALARVGTPLFETRVCAGCGQKLTVQKEGYAYVDINPKARTAVFKHYNCAWTSLMQGLVDRARRAQTLNF